MNLIVALFSAVLFFILTPGILVRLPKNGSKYTVAMVHSLVFMVVFWLLHRFVMKFSMSLNKRTSESMTDKKKKEE